MVKMLAKPVIPSENIHYEEGIINLYRDGKIDAHRAAECFSWISKNPEKEFDPRKPLFNKQGKLGIKGLFYYALALQEVSSKEAREASKKFFKLLYKKGPYSLTVLGNEDALQQEIVRRYLQCKKENFWKRAAGFLTFSFVQPA